MKYSIGVDVGGSHLSCAAVDLTNQTFVENSFSSIAVDNKASSDEIFSVWAKALMETINKIDMKNLAGIGVGMPGPFEYDKGIAHFERNEKYYGLNNVNVAEGLLEKLNLASPVPLRFMNDASAFAVGEAWLGSAANTTKSISITLGTGFGSAFISNGIPVVEGNNVPELGCVWHIPYKDGIADDYFSTRWFIRRYKEETGINASGAKEISEAAATNTSAMALFLEYGNNMGEFFSPWLKKFDAEILVVGGNVAKAYPLFGPAFENTLKDFNIKTKIKLSALNEDAAIIGSARMLDPCYWEKIKPILPKM